MKPGEGISPKLPETLCSRTPPREIERERERRTGVADPEGQIVEGPPHGDFEGPPVRGPLIISLYVLI